MAGFLRGLESITRALLEHQGQEWRTVWQNSSLRDVAQGTSRKVEEAISAAVVSQGDLQVSLKAFGKVFTNHQGAS